MKNEDLAKLWWYIQDLYSSGVQDVLPLAANVTILEQVYDNKVRMRTLTIPTIEDGEKKNHEMDQSH